MIRNILSRNSGAEIEFLIKIQADPNSIPTFVFLCECPGAPARHTHELKTNSGDGIRVGLDPDIKKFNFRL